VTEPSKWRDPGRWFGWLIVVAIGLGVLSAEVRDSHPRVSDGFGVGIAIAVVTMIGLGLFMIFWPMVSRLGDKEERSKLFAELVSKAIGWGILAAIVAAIMGTVWVVKDYRNGMSLLRVPGVGEWMAASRLRDWPSALGEQARDISVDRCDRSDRGFICFLKKLDPDGAYRTIPCYFDGAMAKTWPTDLPISIEAFCVGPAQR
jgi:hypothetical protein